MQLCPQEYRRALLEGTGGEPSAAGGECSVIQGFVGHALVPGFFAHNGCKWHCEMTHSENRGFCLIIWLATRRPLGSPYVSAFRQHCSRIKEQTPPQRVVEGRGKRRGRNAARER